MPDSAFIDGVTFAAYLATALACAREAAQPAAAARGENRFWRISALMLVAIGLARYVELHLVLAEVGRELAVHGGWYEGRRPVQKWLVYGLGVALLAFLALPWLRRQPVRPGRHAALAGVTLLAAFAAARVMSAHRIDVVLRRTIHGLKWEWVLELAGIALVALGVLAHRLSSRPRAQAPQPS